jgi:Sulfotransferase family
VPVLYIGGCQRSGSTLLDRMVSQAPGHVSAGEIVHLWTRGLRANELCGCGVRFSACPFWIEVGRVAFGGWESVDVEEVVRLQRRVDRNRYIFFMLLPRVSPRYRRELHRYVDILDALYRAVYRVGEGIVVDSSKHASTAFLLRRVPSVRLRVVHLVRDSRGVAFSLSKRVRRPESVDEETYMFRSSSWRSGIEWLAFNGLFHVIGVLGTPTTLARYEALVREPRAVLDRILTSEKGSVTPDELAFIDGRTVQLDTDHTVAGNPMRFEHGSFELRVDDAWRTSLDRRDRRITTLLTWPLLAAYGYLRGQDR